MSSASGDVVSAIAPDLGAVHVVHLTLVLRFDEDGLWLMPLDPHLDVRQEHDRLAAQQLTRVISAKGRRLDLVARLVPGARVVPAAVVADVAGEDPAGRDDLEALCRELIAGGLLLEPGAAADAPDPPSRLAGIVECTTDGGPLDVADDQLVRLLLPLALVPAGRSFVLCAHDGSERARFLPADLRIAEAFLPAASVSTVVDLLAAADAPVPPAPRDVVRDVLDRLASVGLVEVLDAPTYALGRAIADPATTWTRSWRRYQELLDGEADALRARTDRPLLVVPVDVDEAPLLSLGTVVSYARAHLPADVRDRCHFMPLWYTSGERVGDMLASFPDHQLVLLYSLYTWNYRDNVAVARAVRELRPDAINVAGGPDLPKSEADAERYLSEHPEIDVAVRGEGEVTFCELLATLARVEDPDRRSWPPALDDVAGCSFRRDGKIVRTAERERLADLDTIPSPYLEGFYDHVEPLRRCFAVLETNRGCPYGCTFCDWGSATLSRIRKFDLDRVKAEIDLAVDRGCLGVVLADANFGMLDRDVEIAAHLVAARDRHGLPKMFNANMAKNRVGNTLGIVSLLADAGILTEGLVSAQSNDPGVLKAIRRSNIKRSTFDALAAEFRAKELPLYTDVMLGLPGSTPATFLTDLQIGIDAEVHVKTHPTQLLVNSPMNAPEYREEHGISARPGTVVTSTSTYTEVEWLQMMRTRQMFYLGERRGMLRQLATYVRAETATPEMAFYEHLRSLAETSPRHPQLAYALRVASVSFLPPGSWRPLVEEVGEVMVSDFGVADDSALRTTLAVQQALLLTRGRRLPVRLDLDHDYVTWQQSVVSGKRAHPGGAWVGTVTPLRDHGPGELVVDDRRGRCAALLGKSTIAGFDNNTDWELDSPVARPVPAAVGAS